MVAWALPLVCLLHAGMGHPAGAPCTAPAGAVPRHPPPSVAAGSMLACMPTMPPRCTHPLPDGRPAVRWGAPWRPAAPKAARLSRPRLPRCAAAAARWSGGLLRIVRCSPALRRSLRAGWLNHVTTLSCHFFLYLRMLEIWLFGILLAFPCGRGGAGAHVRRGMQRRGQQTARRALPTYPDAS